MMSRLYQVRRRSSLPFYCDPLLLFISVWLAMLGSLRFEITNVSYPDFSLPLLIFTASLISFLIGYHLLRIVFRQHNVVPDSTGYRIDLTRLRRFNLILLCVSSVLLIYNLVASGLPPFFGYFGVATQSVNEYGRLKQLLGPMLAALFVNSLLDSSMKRRAYLGTFAFLSMLFYAARGGILLMLFQALIVLSARSTIAKRKIYLAAMAGACAAAVFFGVLGSYRTTDAILFAGMQIKTEFQEWPTIYVWIISYVSTALSNLCWFVNMARFDHITWTFSYTLLPAFWSLPNPHAQLMQSSKIVDGTSTYLATYFLDFSYFGIFLINIVLGMVSGWASLGNRIGRQFLPSSIFLSCLAFIFFWDFFATLSMVILFGVQAMADKYFINRMPLMLSQSNVRVKPHDCLSFPQAAGDQQVSNSRPTGR